MYVSGFEGSPSGIERMRLDEDSLLPELVKTVSDVAFEVDDLGAALAGRDLLIAPNSPSAGLTAAFIVVDGAPVELMKFDSPGPFEASQTHSKRPE
jgi:hypothetical protein